MKNKLYILFILMISFLFINNIEGQSIFKYQSTNDYSNYFSNKINDIISTKDGYIIISNTTNKTPIIYSFDNENNLLTTKELLDIKNASIKKYNDYYIVAGISSNTLKLYLLDNNLQVINQKETSYMIDYSSKINIYINENTIYLMFTEYDILSNNTIYQIDEFLTITEHNFSSYDASKLKEILKSDYFLIKNNDIENNGVITHYYDSTYTEEYNILIGQTPTNAKLTILDNSNSIILDKDITEYKTFNEVLLIKDKIVILASNNPTNYLVTYDIKGNLIDEITIPNTYNDNILSLFNIYKIGNNIVIYSNDINKLHTLSFYSFECQIYKENSLYGTINLNNSSTPYSLNKLTIKPNSGYEIQTITVKDSQGNIIPVINNEFIMPENDVTVSVEYIATITNPETIDLIYIISFITIIGIILILIFYKNLKWLK